MVDLCRNCSAWNRLTIIDFLVVPEMPATAGCPAILVVFAEQRCRLWRHQNLPPSTPHGMTSLKSLTESSLGMNSHADLRGQWGIWDQFPKCGKGLLGSPNDDADAALTSDGDDWYGRSAGKRGSPGILLSR
jgi:hypothetical protein